MSDRDASHTLAELQEARAEVDRLRGLMRWRKWPEEKPIVSGEYLILYFFKSGQWGVYESYFCDGSENDGEIYWFGKTPNFWRPIGPLPGEGGE